MVLAFLALFLLVCNISAYTYWIDESCRRRYGTHVEDAFHDMQKWASRAAIRLADPSDPVQQDYFTRLLSPRNDAAHRQIVLGEC